MSQENKEIEGDLSSDAQLPSIDQLFSKHELEWLQTQTKFKRYLFYVIGGANILLVVALLAYITLPFFCPTQSIPIPERLMVIGILAAMIIVLSLALMRVVYLQSKTKEDTSS